MSSFRKQAMSPKSMEDDNIEQILTEPFEYLSQSKGKEVRAALIQSFQLWLNVDEDILEEIKDIIQQLHTSSLLIDDIEDDSKMRRGVPVAHSIYGVPTTINCANYIYFKAMDKCRRLRGGVGLDCFLDEMIRLHRGQGLDIYWRDHNTCPTEADYKMMVIDKTGGLFRLAVKLMQCFSENKRDYCELANKLALFFQIRDDLGNLAIEEYHSAKGFCEDLTEGKFSFLIIHAIHAQPHDHRLLNILKQRTEDVAIKRYAVQFMQQCGSFEYTRGVLRELYQEILTTIEELGGNPLLSQILAKLAKDVVPQPASSEVSEAKSD